MEQKTKKCPYCGEDILAIAKKCKHCGEWLNNDEEPKEEKVMIPCPVCGEMIEEGISKCPHCHEHLTMQSGSIPVASQPKKEKKNDDDTRSFFDYYLWDPFFRHYADFKGRLNRKHYWISQLVWTLSLVALAIMFPIGPIILMPLFLVASIVPLYATAVRRMRDAEDVPRLMVWYWFSPFLIWWLIKPTEPRVEEMEDVRADTPQPVRFKKADIIVCATYVLLLVIGLIGWKIFLENHKSSEYVSMSDKVENVIDEGNAVDENTHENVKEAYLDFLSKLDAMDEDQVFGQYFLFDITGDGIPELWIESGDSEPEHAISVYTYNQKFAVLDAGEKGNAAFSSFYRGKDYILQVYGHWGDFSGTKITYRNGKLKYEVIFEESLKESDEEEHTEVSEPAVEAYSFDDTEPVVRMFDQF